jgi:potassium voltage-gated channel Eag-related subfamily H member 8
VAGVYWTLTTITTVGYGDISAGTATERSFLIFPGFFIRMYATVLMIVGVCFYSYCIGSISSVLSSIDTREAKLQEKLGVLNDIAKDYDMTTDLYLRLHKTLKYDHNKNVMDKFEFLKQLPQNLKLELSYNMHKEVIEQFPFFSAQPKQFIAFLGPLLKPIKVSKNAYIYEEGDLLNTGIYFLIKGKVGLCLKNYNDAIYVIIDQGILILTLTNDKQDFILEKLTFMIMKPLQNGNSQLKALEDCELLELSKEVSI